MPRIDMARPKKKKKVTKKQRVTHKRTTAKTRARRAQNPSPNLPNLNQIVPKLDFKIAGTPILPGLKG